MCRVQRSCARFRGRMWCSEVVCGVQRSCVVFRDRVRGSEVVCRSQFGEHVYVTDWQSEAIERYDKRTGANKVTVRGGMAGLMGIVAVAPTQQTGRHARPHTQVDTLGRTHR